MWTAVCQTYRTLATLCVAILGEDINSVMKTTRHAMLNIHIPNITQKFIFFPFP